MLKAITNLILEKLYATSMRYIILYTSDVEVSKHFYNEVLGLPIQMKHGTYIKFNTGNTILSLNSREDVRDITGLNIQQPLWFHKHMKSALQWTMWKKQFKPLRNQGVTIVKEPITKPWGQNVKYVAELDEHYIEICSVIE